MEKKTTQRIIGILVAVALLVILMPLVFSKNDLSTQTATIKAPPFPDQQQPQDIQPEKSGSTQAQADITPEMANKINGMPVSPVADSNSEQSSTTLGQANVAGSEMPAEAEATGALSAQTSVPTPDSMSASTSTPESSSASVTSANDSSALPSVTPPMSGQSSEASDAPSKMAAPQDLSAATSAQTTDSNPVVQPVLTKSETSSQSVPASTDNKPLVNSENTVSSETAQPGPESIKVATRDSAPSVVVKQGRAPVDDDEPVTKPITSSEASMKSVRPVEPVVADNQTEKTSKMNAGKISSPHMKIPVTHSKTLSSLKTSGWVIQMGSFRDKDNARRLADRLRGAGYKAFMRDIKSAHGSTQTRVYIGPETKQVAAVELSSKVAQEMNLHGLVLMYKPFEL